MASVSAVSSASAGPAPIFRRKAQFPRRGLGGGFPDAGPRSSGRSVLRDASNERSGHRSKLLHMQVLSHPRRHWDEEQCSQQDYIASGTGRGWVWGCKAPGCTGRALPPSPIKEKKQLFL